MKTKLFVGGLPWETDEEGLRVEFERFGTVVETIVVRDRETGRSRGFGFVRYDSDEEAQAACQAMDGGQIGGRRITVNIARERDGRGPGGGGGGGGGGPGGPRGGPGGGSRPPRSQSDDRFRGPPRDDRGPPRRDGPPPRRDGPPPRTGGPPREGGGPPWRGAGPPPGPPPGAGWPPSDDPFNDDPFAADERSRRTQRRRTHKENGVETVQDDWGKRGKGKPKAGPKKKGGGGGNRFFDDEDW